MRCAGLSKSACLTARRCRAIPERQSFHSRFGPISLVYLRRLQVMVAVAQLVRAPDCGSGGCGFNPRQPPLKNWSSGSWERLTDAPRATVVEQQSMSVAQLVEHRSPNTAPLSGAVFLWVTACLGRHHWHPLVGVDRQSNSKVELSFFHTSSGSHAECRVNEGAQVRGSRGSVPAP